MFVMRVLLFCIIAVFAYLYDFATTDCFNLAVASYKILINVFINVFIAAMIIAELSCTKSDAGQLWITQAQIQQETQLSPTNRATHFCK